MSLSGRFAAARGNLTLLQDVMKRDPGSYRPEFQEQYIHYQQSLKLFHLHPQELDYDHLMELVNFVAQVGHHFKKDSADFAPQLLELLRTQGPSLEADLRLCLVKALILLRNRKVVSPAAFNALAFDHLLKCQDKGLRKFLASSILAHIKSINVVLGKRNGRLSGEIEGFVISKLKDSSTIVVRTALLVLIQAYRKNFWKDTRVANVIAEACFHPSVKIRVTALKFMMGARKDGGGDSDGDSQSDDDDAAEEEEGKTLKDLMVGFKAGKKTKKRKKALDKARTTLLKDSKNNGKRRGNVTAAGVCSYSLIQDLYDAHDFAERLFKSLSKGKGNDRFEVKLLVIGLVSKVIGIHKLILLPFYTFMHKYVQPHQRDVTKILLFAAQASHELVPPDLIAQLVRVVADHFVSDRNAPEVMTVGLNSIREILANCPLAVDEDLLRDLTEYKRYRNKNVSVAARSIITLFRQLNPALLHRKDRGKPTEEQAEAAPMSRYGETRAPDFVPGAEALTAAAATAKATSADDADSDGSWEDDDDEEEEGDELDWDNAEEEELSDASGEDDGVDDKMDSPADAAAAEEKIKLSKEENRQLIAKQAAEVSSGRILSQEEFRAIAVHRLRKQMQPARGKKRKAEESDGEEEELEIDDDDLDDAAEEANKRRLTRLADITHLHKRPKMNKAERMEAAMAGREGRGEFGGGRKKGKPHAGKTNQTTKKGKAFQMVRQKEVKKNRNRSFRQRQQCLKDYLTKQRKMK